MMGVMSVGRLFKAVCTSGIGGKAGAFKTRDESETV